MEAATKNKYITPERLIELTKTGRRGRPHVIPKEHAYFYTQGMICGDTMRTTTNKYYRALGLDVIKQWFNEDVALFKDNKRIKYCGVLEQLGRAGALWEKDKLTDDELLDITERALELIRAGEKSKEIERRIRNMRANAPLLRIWDMLE